MRPIDGDRLMMHLTDWWYSSFGQVETDESKAIKTVIDKIEQTLGEFTLEKQETAKIVVGKSRGGVTLWHECNKCGEPVDAKDIFCRRCGRKLIYESD
jgi:glycerol kinase